MVDQPGTYAIHIKEALGTLSVAFEEFDIQITQHGTILTGYFPDQAALHGVLGRIRDLCLTLISVERVADESDNEEQA
ncbi:MAG: hypothetical protein RLP44_30015 [Aggregatilineales bacterium]